MDRAVHRDSARVRFFHVRKPAPSSAWFANVFFATVFWATVVVTLGSLAGCTRSGSTFGGGDDVKLLTHHIRTTYLRAGQPVEVTTVKIKESIPISDELFRVEFDAEATLVKGTYVQLDKAKMLSGAGWDETAYVAALNQSRNLPADVRTKLDKERPTIDGETRFYRPEGNEGQKLKFEGRCTARWRSTTWNLNELEMKELDTPGAAAHTAYDLHQYKVSVLPPNSREVAGPDGQRWVKSLVEAQKKYVAAVTAASMNVAKEDADSAAQLTALAKTGTAWTVSLPAGNLPAQKWIIEFIDVSAGEILKALVRHPTDELRRRVFAGRILTGRTPELVLQPVENGPSLIYGGPTEELRIRPGMDGGLRVVVNNNNEGRLEPVATEATTKPEAELWAELLKRIEPGTSWTGTARTGSDAAVPIKLTFVDVKPDGSYVRAVGESPLDPITTVVFEGIVNRASVHGWPIVMRAIDSYAAEGTLRDYFAPGGSTIVLAMRDDRFVGHRGVDALQFTSSSKIEPWAGRDQVAARIFAPGVKLTGRLVHDDGSTETDLTVMEVRDNGAYVRVLAQAKEEPYDGVVYEGRFPFSTSMIDGYALELNKRSHLSRPEILFREETGTTLRLRLALDGSSVLGVVLTSGIPQETLTLKIDDARKAAVNTSTATFSAQIKQLLVKNSQWRGSLRDLRESRSAEVFMKILDVNVADGVTMEFTIPRTGGAKCVYEGLLQLGDLRIGRKITSLVLAGRDRLNGGLTDFVRGGPCREALS